MKNEVAELVEPEVTNGTALMQLEKASIDMQIATAHQYPRTTSEFKRKAVDMATMDEDTAASCIYRRPVGGGKNAEGMSVRTAEIVGACYGNLRVGARIIEQTDRYVIAQGVAHDLESNFMSTSEVKECTVKADGKPYSERMSLVVAKVALSKARRDATFQVVPKALCKPIENAVRGLLFGDTQTLDKRRERASAWINKIGIDKKRVFVVLGVEDIEDIGSKELEVLTGLMTCIKNNETSVDEAFPFEVKVEDADKKSAEEEKRQVALDKYVKKITPKLLKLDPLVVTSAFEDHGFSSDKSDSMDAIIDLACMVNSRARLDTIMNYIETKTKEGE